MAVTPTEHNKHHMPAYDGNFAIITGNTNRLFEKVDLWNRLDRIFWSTLGFMPHNWIQDPSAIPPDIMAQLKKDASLIPDKLWQYSPVAFPERIKDKEFLMQLKLLRAKWRIDFIEKRRQYLALEANGNDRELERLLADDRTNLPWVYGPEGTNEGQ